MNESLLAQIEEYLKLYYIDIHNIKNDSEVKYSFSGKKPETWLDRLRRRIDAVIDQMVEDSFAERLWKLLHAKGKTDVEIYKKAHIDRRLFSKIRADKNYKPSKRTVVALAIALELEYEETQDLLSRAGYALSMTLKEDVIIQFFIEHHQYDIFLINEVLYYYGFKPLGD